MGADLNLYDWTGKQLKTGLNANPAGALLIAPASGKYAAQSQLGRSWCLSTPMAGISAVAANVSPLGAGTGQPLVGIFNPSGNTFKASIIRAAVWTVSGAPVGAGGVGWNVIPAPAGITSAGGAGAVNQLTMSQGNADGIRTFVNAPLAGSVQATMLRAVGSFPGTTISATNFPHLLFSEETAGAITVPPGAFAGIAVTIAGTSWFVGASMEFETLPV